MGAHHNHGPSAAEAAHAPGMRRRLLIAFSFVASIVVVQLIGAWLSGSLALLVDLVHSFVDSSGLLIAVVAVTLIARPPSNERTWGYRRLESLAALAQGLLLAGVSIYAIIDGVRRWAAPPEVAAGPLLIVAALSLALNVAAMLALAAGRKASLNMRAAFLEVLVDALGTLAVMVSAILILTTGYTRADTLAAFLIAALIIPRAVILLRDAVRILMDFTPAGLDLDEVRRHMLAVDHVIDVHDLHASTVASGLPTLSAHVVLDDSCFSDGHAIEILDGLRRCIAEDFEVSIEHTTFQLETEDIRRRERHDTVHP
ncbi:cation diffusion facilitator family transporter [Brevibacterium luteolum]|uniref:cation diffusion facilitator family transporter n=1 Tax=Brevibacterium luteolum TaxID=199591 RepID=UPI00223B8BF6|nr:cation diffusion facilitator family transporter [Brevibacterium luteolum]MCT1921760.1 cation diffusion facilitator family transporter [Brevibacterium luteolum]